jgi:hypothetical protein
MIRYGYYFALFLLTVLYGFVIYFISNNESEKTYKLGITKNFTLVVSLVSLGSCMMYQMKTRYNFEYRL